MKIHALYFLTASQKVLTRKKYLFIFLIFNLFFIWLLLYIPVRNIPGNDFKFQLSILTPKDFALLITLSLLTALSLTMNIYILRRQFTPRTSVVFVGQGGLGSVTGVIGSIFGTASCVSCVASLFGFLGIGGIFFLVQYKELITIIAIALLLFSLHFTTRKVLGICDVCK